MSRPRNDDAQDGVDLRDHEAAAARGVEVEEHSPHGGDHEDEEHPEHGAGATEDARRGGHQYACPIPIAMASGTPKMVGWTPLTGSAAAAAASSLYPRTCSGWTR